MTDYEGRLQEVYFENGGAAMRAPASGAATQRNLPDVYAIRRVFDEDEDPTPRDTLRFHAHELKRIKRSSKSNRISFTVQEVLDLIEFSKNWGMLPLCTVFFPYTGGFHSFVPERELLEAKGTETFSVTKDRVQDGELMNVVELIHVDSVDEIAYQNQLSI